MLVVGLCLAVSFSSHAAPITKDNNTTALNVGTSWVGGATPTSSDVARWDSTVTGANTVELGSTTNWSGIEILNPGGPVAIISSVGATLNLGASGIDMSSATADLTISNTAAPNPVFNFAPVASQTWNIPLGRSLIINSNFTMRSNANLTLSGSGNLTNGGYIQLSAVNSTNILNHNAGTYSSGVSGGNPILFVGHSQAGSIPGVGVYNLNGGTIALTGSQQIRMAQNAAPADGTLNVISGAITSSATTTRIQVGYVAGGKGAYNQSGGTVTVGGMDVAANNAGAGTGVATISGGVLNLTAGSSLNIGTVQTGSFTLTNSGRLNLSGIATVSTNGTMNLNGGTLNMATTSAELKTNTATAIVNANGISITNGSSGTVTLAAPMTLGAGGITNVMLAATGGRTTTFSGSLAGAGGILVDIGGTNIVLLSGANTFSGGVIIKNGVVESRTTQTTLGTGTVVMGGTGSSGATYRSGQNNTNAFIINAPDSGTNSIGTTAVGHSFTMSGPITLNGNLTMQTFDNPIGLVRSTATFSGGVTGTGNLLINNFGLSSNLITLTTTTINPNGSITQQGTAIGGKTTISAVIGANVTGVTQNSETSPLILSGVNTYTGNTTVNAGTLLVNSPGSLSAGSAVNVNTNATLGGTGTINGVVTVANGGTLASGDTAIGTLTLNGNVVLSAGSTNVFEVDGTTPANDRVVLGASVTYGGVLQIVPTGTFTNGQKFTLFSGAGATNTGNFASIVGSPGAGLSFNFTNGVLSVVSTGPSGPATLTNSYSAGVLTLSWPAGEGWRLLQQTNALSTGLSTNWVDVTPGSASTTNITVNNTIPTVFYRLVYP